MNRPYLDLNRIQIDPQIVGRIPYDMALYYMAMPLACEDEQISVVMAHPENDLAKQRLQERLGVEVVPVRGGTGLIRSLLQQFHPKENLPLPRVLVCSQAEDRALMTLATQFAAANAAEVNVLSPISIGVEEMLVDAQRQQGRLCVLRAQTAAIEVWLRRAPTPLLLAGDEARSLRKILLVMRGFSSDEYALDYLTPLLRLTGATLTLSPILTPAIRHSPQGEAVGTGVEAQIEACRHQLHERHLHAVLKLRQGTPSRQIADEFSSGDYDLLVIAAEGYGAFVSSVLAEIELRRPEVRPSILVLKPTYS